MSLPTVTFPIAFEAIPAEVKKLTDFIEAKRQEIAVASTMLEMVRRGCKHDGAKRGYNHAYPGSFPLTRASEPK